MGSRDRDDEVDDDVFSEEVEEVVSVSETLKALFDDAKKWVQSLEIIDVLNQGPLLWLGASVPTPVARPVRRSTPLVR